MHRIGEKSVISHEVESRVGARMASMETGLITLMKEQLAQARKQESALVPLEIFLAAPPPFFILRGNKTRLVRAE